jgi:hypothetical protein
LNRAQESALPSKPCFPQVSHRAAEAATRRRLDCLSPINSLTLDLAGGGPPSAIQIIFGRRGFHLTGRR